MIKITAKMSKDVAKEILLMEYIHLHDILMQYDYSERSPWVNNLLFKLYSVRNCIANYPIGICAALRTLKEIEDAILINKLES